MPFILATVSSFGKDFPTLGELCRSYNLEMILNKEGRKLTPAETRALLVRHRPVGLLAGTELLGREIMHEARDFLRVISRVGAGLDNLDLSAAASLGITVYNTPNVLTQAVAELTMGMILSGLRFIPCQDRMMRQGIWRRYQGRLLEGKALGIIGFGVIGRRVAQLAGAFGARIFYYDVQDVPAEGCQALSLDELLRAVDVISLHGGGKDVIIGEKELSAIPPGKGIIIVNTARGSLIDESALFNALNDGRVACACLDVYNEEPYSGPLSKLDNVILSPHAGSYAREARERMERLAWENLIKGLREAGVIRERIA